MIGWLALKLVASNPARTMAHARRLAKIGIAAAAVVLILLALALTVWLIRRDAVQDHEAGRALDTVQAERRATTNDNTRQAAREHASEATTEQLETIHAEDPETAVRPASASDRAVADRLRAR